MLEVKNLSKSFDKNYVLKNINIVIKPGEVYGIIGANGSGKSTLMNILNGSEVIEKTGGYEGSILIDGQAAAISGHKDSIALGIAMVHQELALFPGMSVAENIKINRENTKTKGFILPELALVDKRQNVEDARRTLERIGVDLIPNQNIDGLSLNQKQFVEIARELDNQRIRLLMLDEPTSSLNITETKGLLRRIREIAKSGISVIFVSHRLEEIMEVCDTVSVLRDGELIETYGKADFDIHKFAQDMVGCEIVKANKKVREGSKEILFRYENINGTPNKLEFYKGEIIGITGLAGQGQEQFLQGLFGLKEADYQAFYKDKKINRGDNQELIKHNIYYLSDDRAGTSLFLESPVWKNIMFGTEEKHPEFYTQGIWRPLSFLKKDEIRDYTMEMIEKLNIVCQGPEQKVRELSGGNQQKVCVGRAITFQPELLFVEEPTRGIDIYSKELILQWLIRVNQELRTTVVVSSGELEELIRICDRIAVMYQGQVFRIFGGEISLEQLTYALYGRDCYEN